MRKSILIIAILSIAALCFAGPLQEMHKRVIAGSTVAAGGSSCPSFYDATNVIISWDGDHSSGTNYLCESDGDAVAGTNTNLPISTDYGESSSNGSLHDTIDERLRWTQTADQYFDNEGPQTLWIRAYFTGTTPTNDIVIFEASDESLTFDIKQDNAASYIVGTHISNVNAGGSLSATGSWVNIAYSWDTTEQDHSVYNGSTWEDDNNELVSTGNDVTEFSLGNYIKAVASEPTEDVQVTQWALMSGYKAGVPW
jgi:hypothetical protein